MAGIIKKKGRKPIIVNGVADHAHLFRGRRVWRFFLRPFSDEYSLSVHFKPERTPPEKDVWEEYLEFLNNFEIPYEDRFLFKWLDV